MKEQRTLQTFLRLKLTELQERNSRYSVRAFAKRLGLQPSATNEILKGERQVSYKMAERIANRLLLDPTERNELLKEFPRKKRIRRGAEGAHGQLETSLDYLKLTTDQFETISDWWNFAILSLVKLPSFQSDPAWISERLGITEVQAKKAIERLLRLGLLERLGDGTLKRTRARFNTTDDVTSPAAIRKSHLGDMELARLSLLRDPVESRDFTSLTLTVSPRLLPKAKEMIRKAQDEIQELLESEPGTEVYRLSSYLFPLSRPANRPSTPNTTLKNQGSSPDRVGNFSIFSIET